ncbi:MAG TPA: transposase [Terriglobia bacterium]|nr:transposase [Terriglobia bacterium]
MSRHRFEAYLDKVFDFSAQVAALPEGRRAPRHPWEKVWNAVFLGAAIQIPNVHRLEAEGSKGVLKQRIGPRSEDAMGYALQRQDPAPVFTLGCEVARRLKRNGVLRSDWARGRVVAAVDGIEIGSSFARCCDTCMERKVQHKVDGQLREDTQYYHRIVAVVVVSTAFSILLGIRFQKDGETEVACAVALLRDLDRQLGRRFINVLVADALYLQSGFTGEVEDLGLEWVITLKENQPELLAEARRLTGGPAEIALANGPEELQLWYAPEVYWPVADRSLHVVKTFRVQQPHRVQVSCGEKGKKKKTKQTVRQESTNYYASNLDLGSIPPPP